MKNLFFSASSVLLFVLPMVSFGRVDTVKSFKPSKGAWAFEINTNLNFNGSNIFSLNDGLLQNIFDKIDENGTGVAYPLIKCRRFVSNSVAERYLVNVTLGSTSESGSTQTTSMGFSIGYGREKHFKGTNRLSPYLGWDLSVAYASIFAGNNVAGFGLGMRGLTGMDYYFAQNLYLGIEFGLGLNGTICGSAPSTTDINLKPIVNPVLRFGYNLFNAPKKSTKKTSLIANEDDDSESDDRVEKLRTFKDDDK